MSTPLWSLAAVVTLAFLLATTPAEAQAPIKIGASLSLTGTYAKPGTYQKEGYEVCADELNAKGGLLGRKVEFVRPYSAKLDRMAQCESGGRWHINTGNNYFGGLQFSLPTWRSCPTTPSSLSIRAPPRLCCPMAAMHM